MKDDNRNIVSLRGVNKTYRINEHVSVGVKDINFDARPGELVLLLGPSGSGKTTLLTLIAGLLKPSEGSISLFQKPIESYSVADLQSLRADRIGFIFQTFLLIDALTSSQNIELVVKFNQKSKKEARRIAETLLKELNIEYLADKLPATMSQGEKQRVAVARAVANNAELILADEPTASLDTENGSIIIELLSSFARDNKCVIVASHDLRLKKFADRIVFLDNGRIVE
ncbi:MAG: ATP-binding cassette domain-containing protein [Ignavibacteria bacterium]|nr:ATP-binding cassette domain-containing protein [Ignavibacteria bacterium]MBK6877616.1 ATP-binding cassette domain-containing protein [Ignavibacteria bacterium]